jgi:Domain of unknown function (DUF4198)
MQRRSFLKTACASWLLCAAGAAFAHDTWFRAEALPAQRGDIVMALGTGNQFPVHEVAVHAAHLHRSGCRGAGGDTTALRRVADTPTALIVRAPMHDTVATCWAQLVPFEIELDADKVRLYLKEINAPRAVRDAWAQMCARGVGWKERYTKHARIELQSASQAASAPLHAKPVGMGMDVLLESGLQVIRAGDALVFQVLRDGAPLADFAVELRSDQHRLGIWRKTDAQGRVRITAPLAGKWVLRGTELRLAKSVPDLWESRFVTLAFEVAPAAD